MASFLISTLLMASVVSGRPQDGQLGDSPIPSSSPNAISRPHPPAVTAGPDHAGLRPRKESRESSLLDGLSTRLPSSVPTPALATVFTPPPSCAQSAFTQLSSPNFFVWLWEPAPVPGESTFQCYPTEFAKYYSTVQVDPSLVKSIVPMMSPLACPSGWKTAFKGSSDYIACCPQSYILGPPFEPIDTDRPAYGGTCWSELSSGSTFSVRSYDSESFFGSQDASIPDTGYSAFAHPIDGIALKTSSTSDTSSTAAPKATAGKNEESDDSGLSGGAIAGIVIGVLLALAIVVAGVFFLLRRRKRRQPQQPLPAELGPGVEAGEYGLRKPEPAAVYAQHEYRPQPIEKDATELDTLNTVYAEHDRKNRELANMPPAELDAGFQGQR